jgi:hypothetical protein
MARKFNIGSLKSTFRLAPPRVVVHGDEKTGKSTFACSAAGTVALDIENRLGHIDVPAWRIDSWEDVFDALATLASEKHDFKMVAIDTASALEPLVKEYIVREYFKGNIKDAEAYSAWVRSALSTEWPRFFVALERLVRERDMGWAITCHSQIKSVNSPIAPEYTRFQIALQGQVPGIFRHNCDDLGFVTKEDFFVKDGKRMKGSTSGASIVHWTHSPAYEAGNSVGLPDEMPLDWGAYIDAREAGWNRLPTLLEDAKALLKEITDAAVVKKARAHITANKNNVNVVQSAVNRLRVLIQQQEEAKSASKDQEG